MSKKQITTGFGAKISRRYIVLTIVLALAVYVLVPQLLDFGDSWTMIANPAWQWVGLAGIAAVATYLAGAGTYYLLAFSRLPYSALVMVQFAAMFVNRLLPGGVGALGANYLYLRNHRHNSAQAAVVVAVNNLLGVCGHTILIVLLALILGSADLLTRATSQDSLMTLAVVGVVMCTVFVLARVIAKQRFVKWLGQVRRQLAAYRRRPAHLSSALLTSMLLTLANSLCLYAACKAVGGDVGFGQALLILSLGVSAGVAVPTPGGLGGFEAGLTAGFIAFGLNSQQALAAALLYRLISYWLVLLFGALAFVALQRRGWFAIRPNAP